MTIAELFEKIKTDENLKKDFINASKTKENFENWLHKNNCDASLDDFKKFIDENNQLSDQELENAAGGDEIITCEELDAMDLHATATKREWPPNK